MTFAVEFPLPDAGGAQASVARDFPRAAPLGDDIDFDFLASQFPLVGGDIRNVVLDAAFLAAQDGQVISMKSVVQALARASTSRAGLRR